ncbi:unnamed protein product [Caenorhabditis brenneri]
MPILRPEEQFGFSNISAFTIYGELLGETWFSLKDMDAPKYEAWFQDKKQGILAECRSKSKQSDHCQTFVDNGYAMFCKWTRGFSFCASAPNFVHPPTTTTTTTTTVQTTTPVKSFPVGLLIGGFMAGALIGFILMIIVLCLCKKKEKTGNRKNGKHTTGTYSGNTGTATGTTGTTSGTTGTTATKKKKKAKKAKKGKKGKKGSNTSAETNTASAY